MHCRGPVESLRSYIHHKPFHFLFYRCRRGGHNRLWDGGEGGGRIPAISDSALSVSHR